MHLLKVIFTCTLLTQFVSAYATGDVTKGTAKYKQMCITCHGAKAEGKKAVRKRTQTVESTRLVSKKSH